ncbi:MAG: TIGR00730 family Rossman fold protein [Ignavibacteria bacterium]|nr:TIGR00730 family Rossman fold protein [Ignavibacteria bacterium]
MIKKKKKFTEEELHPKHPLKAYDNKVFIHSSEGRIIRILAEYLYPEQHFRKHGIKKTIIFFGSSRIRPKEKYIEEIDLLRNKLDNLGERDRQKVRKKIQELEEISENVGRYYTEAYELSRKIAEWSKTLPPRNRYYICSGGGPGIMEAANRGSFDAGLKTIGLNISLPFEQEPNQYITKELNFEFHYFFMRKFWLVYPAQALIVFPGGYGTIDELMEILTLRQTGKMKKPRLILVYGSDFWSKVIDFNYLAQVGMISRSDLRIFKFADTPNQAFEIIVDELNSKLSEKVE